MNRQDKEEGKKEEKIHYVTKKKKKTDLHNRIAETRENTTTRQTTSREMKKGQKWRQVQSQVRNII